MALNNRIYKFTCDVCARSIERIADPARPDPLRCVITDQCSGKLKLTSTRFGLRPANTATVIGVLDRIKRGTPRTDEVVTKPLDKASLSSFAVSRGVTLAVLQAEDTPANRRFYVTSAGGQATLERPTVNSLPITSKVTAVMFELTPAALEYKRYTYSRVERAVFVQGKDDSAAQSPLAFDLTSTVRVFVNGSLLDASLYDKSTLNVIRFTPELEADSLLIEVFVYKSLTQFFTEEDAVRVDFVGLSLISDSRTTGAWGDAQKIGQYWPLYCNDISPLDTSKTYGVIRFEAVNEALETITLDPVGFIALATSPYSYTDKRLSALVPLSALLTDGFPISFQVNGETGALEPAIDGEALQPLIRPLSYTKLEAAASSAQSEAVVSLTVERSEKAFILGPT